MCGGVHDVITGNKFHQNPSRGFRATGVQKSGTPIDLACRPYNSSALPCWLWCEFRLNSMTGRSPSGSATKRHCNPEQSCLRSLSRHQLAICSWWMYVLHNRDPALDLRNGTKLCSFIITFHWQFQLINANDYAMKRCHEWRSSLLRRRYVHQAHCTSYRPKTERDIYLNK